MTTSSFECIPSFETLNPVDGHELCTGSVYIENLDNEGVQKSHDGKKDHGDEEANELVYDVDGEECIGICTFLSWQRENIGILKCQNTHSFSWAAATLIWC